METTVSGMEITLVILLIGVLVGLSRLSKALLEKIGLPGLVGWILIGVACGTIGRALEINDSHAMNIMEFMARLGVIVLLFRIGLESRLARLMEQLRPSVVIWLANVLASGVAGYVVARYVLGLPVITGIIIGTALTATSVGTSVGVWKSAGALDTGPGCLLLDTAELDDISSIILMGFLFALLPLAGQEVTGDRLLRSIGATSLIFIVKMLSFLAFCIVFSRYLEKPFSEWIKRYEPDTDRMLTVAGTGFVISAMAGVLGFSPALGAFFAGLAFSRDPESVKIDASFESIYNLLSPFFFIGIGLGIELSAVGDSALAVGAIFTAAILGKIIGTFGAAWPGHGWRHGLILGVSMIPRSEITLIIMEHARKTHDLVSGALYSSVAAAALLTCIVSPPVMRKMIDAWLDPA